MPELDKLTVTGLQELDDGRVIEVFNRIKVITPPENLTSHPIRDVWLLDKHKWVWYQKNVAWEEAETLDEILDKEYDACICVYRRSGRDYRRHAEAEAYLIARSMESGIRGVTSTTPLGRVRQTST